MSTILDKIIAHKFEEVKAQKSKIPLSKLLEKERSRPYYSLKENLLMDNASGIIAEFKRRSPSKNWINKEAVSANVVPEYAKAGASGSSILTDTNFFGGETYDITSVANQVKLPLLRKDFIVDEYQIIEANKMGADVILLIAACLSPERVKQLAKTAKDNKLEVLLEIHNKQELEHICDDITLVGVNNRNLHNFETSLETSVELSSLIPDKFIKISESGIRNANDIIYLRSFGFKGFLIGESFMKTNEPGNECKQFIDKL